MKSFVDKLFQLIFSTLLFNFSFISVFEKTSRFCLAAPLSLKSERLFLANKSPEPIPLSHFGPVSPFSHFSHLNFSALILFTIHQELISNSSLFWTKSCFSSYSCHLAIFFKLYFKVF